MIIRYETELDSGTHLAVLSALSEKMTESVMITEAEEWSADPRILYVNPAFTRLTGYGPDEAIGQTPKFLQGERTERAVLDRLKLELFIGRAWQGQTFNYTKSGQPFLMEWEIVPIHDPDGRLRFFLTIQRRVDTDDRPATHRLDAGRRGCER